MLAAIFRRSAAFNVTNLPSTTATEWGYGATVARLTPDQKVGSSNLSALIFFSWQCQTIVFPPNDAILIFPLTIWTNSAIYQ